MEALLNEAEAIANSVENIKAPKSLWEIPSQATTETPSTTKEPRFITTVMFGCSYVRSKGSFVRANLLKRINFFKLSLLFLELNGLIS